MTEDRSDDASTAIHLMHRLAFWRWPKRLICHESTACCQYVDQPNCNIGPRPKGWQNGSSSTDSLGDR